MRFLIVGGSNSLISGGYLETALARLRGFPDVVVDEIANLSIGSVSCMRGLETLKRYDRLAAFDVVVLEYAVNDYVFDQGAHAMWAAAYEGLIRHVAATAPGARVVSLTFGRREAVSHRGQERRRRRLDLLNRRYNSSVIDVDAELLVEHAGDPAAFAALYETPAHYRRPDVARRVGERVAEGLRDVALSKKSVNLAPPLSSFQFGDAQVIDAFEVLDLGGTSGTRFENSRFQTEAATIPLGETISVDLAGPLIGLSYVSTPHACSILLEENGVRSLIHTAFGAQKGMSRKARRFPFLMHNIAATWTRWGWRTELGPRRVTLTAVAGDDPGGLRATVRPTERRHSMVPNAVSPAAHVTALTAYASDAPPGRLRRAVEGSLDSLRSLTKPRA